MLLIYLGLAVFIIGGIGFLITAFKNSILWGLGCLLLYPVSIIFLILNWNDAKNPFLLQLLGIGIMLVGSVFSSPTHI
ncbi:hypothetical protein E0409_03160 [Acinetobacter sp. ANC 4862]|jgi:hypothetical protein|nr:hypothetical protein E0409_03160 [Acinetobacter sp. ANC 4862]